MRNPSSKDWLAGHFDVSSGIWKARARSAFRFPPAVLRLARRIAHFRLPGRTFACFKRDRGDPLALSIPSSALRTEAFHAYSESGNRALQAAWPDILMFQAG